MNLFKFIVVIAMVGFAATIFSGANYNSFDFNNLSQSFEKLLNSTDFGSLSGIVSDMKEAFFYIKDQALKLIDLVQNSKH